MTGGVLARVRALPTWARVVLALVLAAAVAWLLRAAWAGAGAFVLALLGVRRPSRGVGVASAARDLGRAEGGARADAEDLTHEAEELRGEVDAARERDAAADDALAAAVRREAETVAPPPVSGMAPRSEAVERWLRRGRP